MSKIRPMFGDIGGNVNDNAALSAAFNSTESNINYLSGEIASNDTDINYLSGQIDTVSDKTDDVYSTVYSNSGDWANSNYDDEINYLSGQIDTNSNNISSNDSDISSLSAQVLSNDDDITYLSGEIDKIETTLNNNDYQLDTTDRSTTLNSWSDYTTWTTTSLVSGEYLAMLQYEWSCNTTRNKADFRILIDGTQQGEIASIESKDSNNKCYESFFNNITLSGGTHNITLQYKKNSTSNYTITIYDASYFLQKLGV